LVPVILAVSIFLGLLPLAGIAWLIFSGTITTVDGLFEGLILLAISGIFFLNIFWEMRDRGFLPFLSKVKGGSKSPRGDES